MSIRTRSGLAALGAAALAAAVLPVTGTVTAAFATASTSARPDAPATAISSGVAPSGSPTSSGSSASSGSRAVYTGLGSWYPFDAGACGTGFDENADVVALGPAQFNSALCGKKITIINDLNGKQVTAKVADKCMKCIDGIGLSQSDETKLGGLFDLPQIDSWSFQ